MANIRKVDESLLIDYVKGNLEPKIHGQLKKLLENRPDLRAQVDMLSSQLLEAPSLQASSGLNHATPTPLPQLQPAVLSDVPEELANSEEYEILRELNRGGMGVVYLAKNLAIERVEVLKVLNPRLYANATARERFLTEIRATAKLNHPAIVTCYRILPLESLVVFSMEYVPGVDLRQYIEQNHPLSTYRACNFAEQISSGLKAAHAQQLVHRDIKPSNIMVFQQESETGLKILDFGLAKVMNSASQAELTQAGNMLGTIEYMSPEQILNPSGVDIRTDIYSLGCTLFHLLVGAPPFQGTPGEVMMAQVKQEPPMIHLLRPDVPAQLAAIVAKMMAKNREQRFGSAGDVLNALQPFAAESPTACGYPTLHEDDNTYRQAIKSHDRTVIDGVSSRRQTSTELVASQQSRNTPLLPTISTKNHTATSRTIRLGRLGGGLVALVAVMFVALALFLPARETAATLVLQDFPQTATVLIDGHAAEVAWDATNSKATIIVQPGSHHIEAKQGTQTLIQKTVSLSAGNSKVISLPVSIDSPKTSAADEPAKDTLAEPVSTASDHFDRDPISLFDGKSFDGWIQRQGCANFSIEHNTIVGRVGYARTNSYLCTERIYDDFILELDVKVDPGLSTAIHVRNRVFDTLMTYPGIAGQTSNVLENHIHGYQISIDPQKPRSIGSIHEMGMRGLLKDAAASPERSTAFKPDQWNHYQVECRGNSIKTWLNDILVSDLQDNGLPSGFIAIQFPSSSNHASQLNKTIRWKNIRLTPLKAPRANSEADVLSPPKDNLQQAVNTTPESFWWIDYDQHELVHDSTSRPSYLQFGNPLWTDYKLTLEACKVSPNDAPGGFGISCRATNESNRHKWELGSITDAGRIKIVVYDDGRPKVESPTPSINVQPGHWIKLEANVSGDTFQCFVNGEEAFHYTNPNQPSGGVALSTFGQCACRFRNIKVTAADGTVLWEGLPTSIISQKHAYDEPSPTLVPIFNGQDLAGWTYGGRITDLWRVEKGILLGKSYPNFDTFKEDIPLQLSTIDQNYRNLELKARVKLNQSANTGLVFRRQDEECIEIKLKHGELGSGIYWSPKRQLGLHSMTSIFGNYLSANVRAKPDEWFDLRVKLVENHMEVFIDDRLTFFADVSRCKDTGPISIWQNNGWNGETAIKDMVVRKID